MNLYGLVLLFVGLFMVAGVFGGIVACLVKMRKR